METIKLSKKEAKFKFNQLDKLAGANIPDENGWYAVQRAHGKLYPIIKPMIKRRGDIEKKMINRDDAGIFTGKLKPEYTFEEYEKAIEGIESEKDEIEIDLYKIKISTLKNATLTNKFGNEVKIPPALITDIEEWIIFDYEFEDEDEESERPKPPPAKPITK